MWVSAFSKSIAFMRLMNSGSSFSVGDICMIGDSVCVLYCSRAMLRLRV